MGNVTWTFFSGFYGYLGGFCLVGVWCLSVLSQAVQVRVISKDSFASRSVASMYSGSGAASKKL